MAATSRPSSATMFQCSVLVLSRVVAECFQQTGGLIRTSCRGSVDAWVSCLVYTQVVCVASRKFNTFRECICCIPPATIRNKQLCRAAVRLFRASCASRNHTLECFLHPFLMACASQGCNTPCGMSVWHHRRLLSRTHVHCWQHFSLVADAEWASHASLAQTRDPAAASLSTPV